ncbi:TetR/AcrR family transcriptional regulator [Paenibacillus azoreducens]|uniref:TetR family transcriptional regulator n=1 Tax=Paenibacillus azoreducens TaxID=116718 RepID=A0A920CVC3_9BACL|nr:TetR/AcrR family transcriptional regulator [Paenibacillus azoreducens]GIO50278.1 TetR family transcriptional regulator [Paenibacillus azoreducens]
MNMNKKMTYEVILETSYRLFAEHGFEKTSMSMIAKELGISKPALYYHFASKEALIDVLFEEICRGIDFSRFFDKRQYTKGNFEQRFIEDGLNMIGHQDQNYLQIMNQYHALGYREPKYMRMLIEILEGYTKGFAELLQHGVDLGVLPEQDVMVRAEMLTMIMDGMDNFMSYGFECRYEDIWKVTVLSLIKGDRVP